MTKTTNWAKDLPHMPVREFISDILHSEAPAAEKDEGVCRFLGVPIAPVTQEYAAAFALIPENCWFHISHLEVSLSPTVPVKGMESVLDNAGAYDRYGSPVKYEAHIFNDKSRIPLAICEALLKAKYDLPVAFVVHASQKEKALNEKQWWERSSTARRQVVATHKKETSRIRRALQWLLYWHYCKFIRPRETAE